MNTLQPFFNKAWALLKQALRVMGKVVINAAHILGLIIVVLEAWAWFHPSATIDVIVHVEHAAPQLPAKK